MNTVVRHGARTGRVRIPASKSQAHRLLICAALGERECTLRCAGASNDIDQATKLTRAMITRYGMSEEFDMVALETVTNQYLGGDTSLVCSTDTQNRIDKKVVELVKAQHEKAKNILLENRAKLDELAQYLYEKETITGEEFMNILRQGGGKQ